MIQVEARDVLLLMFLLFVFFAMEIPIGFVVGYHILKAGGLIL